MISQGEVPNAESFLNDPLSNNTTAGTAGTCLPRVASKTITFTGASTLGLHGTATTCFTVTGLILVEFIGGRVTTNLEGATATLTLGVTSATTLFIGTTTATDLLTTAANWVSTTPTAGGLALPAAMQAIATNANVLCSSTHVSADVTAGVLEINMIWRPLTPGATVT